MCDKDYEIAKRITQILKDAGVKISVGSCGCCDSPWVTLVVDGEKLTCEGYSIDTIDEDVV